MCSDWTQRHRKLSFFSNGRKRELERETSYQATMQVDCEHSVDGVLPVAHLVLKCLEMNIVNVFPSGSNKVLG